MSGELVANLLILVLWASNAHLMAYLAKERNKSYKVWAIIGYIFGPFAWLPFFIVMKPEVKEYQ